MADFLITYLDATADDRDFGAFEVKFSSPKGLVTFNKSFCVVLDSDKSKNNYYHESRILQIDVRLNAAEEQNLVRDEKKAMKATVYYHKIEIDRANLSVRRVRCVGAQDRPFGFECYLADNQENDYFLKLITPSFRELVYVPISKIIGMEVAQLG